MVQWLFHQTGALGLKGSEHQRVALEGAVLRADRAGPDHVKVPRRKQLVVRRAQRLIKAGPSEVQSAMTPRKQFSTAGHVKASSRGHFKLRGQWPFYQGQWPVYQGQWPFYQGRWPFYQGELWRSSRPG